MQCTQAGGLEQPAGSMLALPLLDFPNGQFILSSTWHLANGRDGNQHHLFPADPTARQGPMLPADHFTTSALDVQLHAVVGEPAAKTGKGKYGTVRVLQSGCTSFLVLYTRPKHCSCLSSSLPRAQYCSFLSSSFAGTKCCSCGTEEQCMLARKVPDAVQLVCG